MTEETKARRTPREVAQANLDAAVAALGRAEARKGRVDAENGALVEKYERLAKEKAGEITDAAEAVKKARQRVEFLGLHPDLADESGPEPGEPDDGEKADDDSALLGG